MIPLRLPRAVAACAFTLAALAGCHHRPTAGAPCKIADQLLCAGGDRAVVCEGTAWLEVPCRGPHGCARRGESDECDDTVAATGDACPRSPPLDYACTSQRSAALVCHDGRFALWRDCRGPERCEIVDGRNLRCDTTLGEPGDPCEKQGTYACAVDQKTMLACDGSKLVATSSCRGPEGCRVQRDARKVDCDDSLAVEGDPCDQPKRITCSADRKSELVCDSDKYERKRDCRHTDCKLEGNELFCD